MSEYSYDAASSSSGSSATSSSNDQANHKNDFINNDPRFDCLSPEEQAEYKSDSTSEARLNELEDKGTDAYFATHPGENTIYDKNGNSVLTQTDDSSSDENGGPGPVSGNSPQPESKQA